MIVIDRTVSLDGPVRIEQLSGMTFTHESGAHTFRIGATRNGEEVALTGGVTARFIRADGQSFLLAQDQTGIEGGKALVTLHQDCYNVPGRFKIAVFLTNTGDVTCIYAAVGRVQATDTGEIIDTGDIVPDIEQLIEAINDAVESIPADYSTLEAGAVRHDIAQSLDATHKAQALSNLGIHFSHDGNGTLTWG